MQTDRYSTRRLLSPLERRIRTLTQPLCGMWYIDLPVSYSPDLPIPANIADDADGVDGAPCCVQLVGRHMHEEELLDMTETVSDALTKG